MDLLSQVCETLEGYLALGNETTELPLARFVCNPRAPRIYDANHASRLRAETPGEIQAVFARAEQVFSGLGHRRFLCDPFTPPPFEAQLVQQGYRVDAELQLLLGGELRASPPEIDLRLAEAHADWDAIARLTRPFGSMISVITPLGSIWKTLSLPSSATSVGSIRKTDHRCGRRWSGESACWT